MARPFRSATIALVIAVVLASALAGCAGDAGGVSLADTKGPAQLLRNSVAGRLPTDMVAGQSETDDTSQPCSSDGVKRYWRSSVVLDMTPDHGRQVFEVLESLSRRLAEDGWTAKDTSPSKLVHALELSSMKTQSIIDLTAALPSSSANADATVEVAVQGPCVVTDGPDSDEVKHLEAGD